MNKRKLKCEYKKEWVTELTHDNSEKRYIICNKCFKYKRENE